MFPTKSPIDVAYKGERVVQFQNRHVHAAQAILHAIHLLLLLLAQVASSLRFKETLQLTPTTRHYGMLHHDHLLSGPQVQYDHVDEVDQRVDGIAKIVCEQVKCRLRATIRLPRNLLCADETVVHQREDRLGVTPMRIDIQCDTPSPVACRSWPPAAPPASCACAAL